jgi:hypothetical protein
MHGIILKLLLRSRGNCGQKLALESIKARLVSVPFGCLPTRGHRQISTVERTGILHRSHPLPKQGPFIDSFRKVSCLEPGTPLLTY